MAEIISEKNAKEVMQKIGVCKEGIDLMLPKSKFRLIKVSSVRNAIANILKQEMLSVGGDAAVSAGTVGCKVPTTDVLLMGTLRQYELLVQKMKTQVSESKELAEEIETALNEELNES